MEKRCVKCRELKNEDQFCEFIATTKNGKVKQRRNTCYDCNYRKHIYKTFTWKTATKQQILEQLEKRFNKYVIKQNGCWNWKGFVRPDGYTRMRFGFHTGQKSLGGHVISWMIHKKDVDIEKYCRGGFYILHHCDNRKCTNPKHLFLGDSRDNMIDAISKGRLKAAKLSYKQVITIKRMLKNGITARVIAKQYDVHEATISDIKKNITWKYVN